MESLNNLSIQDNVTQLEQLFEIVDDTKKRKVAIKVSIIIVLSVVF